MSKVKTKPKRQLPALIGLLLIMLICGSLVVWARHSTRPSVAKSSASNLSSQQPAHPLVAKKPPGFDAHRYSLINPTSPWVIVSKARPLNPLTYAPTDLTAVGNGQMMRRQAATALLQMFAAASKVGLSIHADSGYRSYQTQVAVYGNEVKNYGQKVADTESARPGHSEHQTGWAVDVGGGGCDIDNCFGNTAQGKWVAANAYKYGFIVRYTAAKQAITGYRAEPWHLRYIGTYLSLEMHRRGITTPEEFFGLPSQNAY